MKLGGSGSKTAKMEGDDEDFKALIYKYEILCNQPSLEADSDEIISFLDQPVLRTHESSSGSPIATVPKEISMIHDLRSTWQLQKEIYELETTKQEKILRKRREKLYKSFQCGKEVIDDVLEDLQYFAKNEANIQKILNTDVGENSLQIPRHLHEQTIGFFKTMADICNNYESMASTFAKEVDFEEAFANLSEAVCSKDFDVTKREIDAVRRYLNILKTTPVIGREESSAQYQHRSGYESNDVTTKAPSIGVPSQLLSC